jgi:hypothetical protein
MFHKYVLYQGMASAMPKNARIHWALAPVGVPGNLENLFMKQAKGRKPQTNRSEQNNQPTISAELATTPAHP